MGGVVGSSRLSAILKLGDPFVSFDIPHRMSGQWAGGLWLTGIQVHIGELGDDTIEQLESFFFQAVGTSVDQALDEILAPASFIVFDKTTL